MPTFTTLFVLLALWVVLGLLIGALASLVVKGEPPYGLGVDIGASVVAMIGVGLIDYFVLPLFKITGVLFFVTAIVEPACGAAIVLWLLRRIKRRQSG